MKYYLVAYNGNYADEFDVYFHQVMSEDELEDAKNIIGKTNWDYEEFYFGTNEWIDVNKYDLIECLNKSRELTNEQYRVLQDLGLCNMGFGDGLNWNDILECANNYLETDE